MRALAPRGEISPEIRTFGSRTARGTLPPPTRRVDLRNGQLHRLLLAQVAARPDPLEEVESQVPAERGLDHLRVPLVGARRRDPRGPQDILGDVEGRLAFGSTHT